jgi:superfamily II DNA or RNA helicase
MITLVHPFKDILPNVDEFFLADNGVGVINTINVFCDRAKRLAEKYALTIDPEKFKGDALELLAECLIKTNEADNRVGIWNYVPDITDDYGVDGHGIGENQHPATVQVKFRRGDYILNANDDHLTNFLFSSQNKFGVRIEDAKNMLLITTGMKVADTILQDMFMGKIRVLNREALRIMLDNRPEWWIRFYDAVKTSRTAQSNTPAPKVTLRQHQSEAAETAIESVNVDKGKIILPTGTGKTLVEAEIVRKTIEENKGKHLVVKFNSPRILLCFQLFKDVSTYLNSYGISAVYVNYNSGNVDSKFLTQLIRQYGGTLRQVKSTTSIQELQAERDKAVALNLPLIVFSTYHSAEKFAASGIVPDLTIHDEAHNLVSREFSNVASLQTGRSLFFTATERNDGPEINIGLGMNNKQIFGETLYAKSPKEMIEAGEMVPPCIHVVRARAGTKQVNLDKLNDDPKALVLSIADAFLEHQKVIGDKIGAKVLVVCRGQQDLEDMLKKHAENEGETATVFGKFRKQYPKIHIFALSSDFGVYCDGKYNRSAVTHASKYNLLSKLQTMSPLDQAIIFHVDMIGEGIDVPGITGVMPFRNSDEIKFVQNIGRASRLHPEDRKKVYAGELTTLEREKWIKPRSWVIVPKFLENSEGFLGRFRRIIAKMREEYGWTKEDVIISNVEGLSPEPEIPAVNEKSKNRPHTDSGVTQFEHDFEDFNSIEGVIFGEEVQKEYEKACAALDKLLRSAIVKV